jgi:HD-like signal output (HDOD) protein
VKVFGATHADIGAYLLGLWGLPVPIVEAVALHHEPHKSIHRNFSPLTAVHIANVIEQHQAPRQTTDLAPAEWDLPYLAEVGVKEFLPYWVDKIAVINLAAAA